MFPTWNSDDSCGLLPHIVWTFRPFISLQCWHAGVSGFWCHRLERPASPRRICVVTHGFQTTTRDLSVFPFLPRHYHMTRVLLSPSITTVWTPVVLAIINIIQATLKVSMMMIIIMIIGRSQWSSGSTLACCRRGPRFESRCGLCVFTKITAIRSFRHGLHTDCSA